MKKLRYLFGRPKGFPRLGAPIGLWVPSGGSGTPVDPGDTTIRYIQNDYFGEEYFGTDWR